jgi:beta-xylosidase
MAAALLRGLASVVALLSGPWQADRGDGTYRNPVLHADYSDPDVVRVGDDFYLVASSFGNVPALPLLHSRDLVNWTLIGHAADRLPSPDFDTPQHGKGVWAPSLRHHDGFFWIYFGDPDRGIYMTRARDPRGPWEPLHLVKAAKGWIDPCPLWDEDGSMYLVHAWARSRAGFNSVLHVQRLSPDGRSVAGEGTRIFDGTARHPTIEGPKFHKRNGWYYVFAPAGGVKEGWQAVLRARHVLGPYEDRIVLDRGTTSVNGPHQGAWVDTPEGQDWFVHFQDRDAYGRITHLQPMAWKDDWPVIGSDPDGDGKGEPVAWRAKPRVRASAPIAVPATSDEFDGGGLGLQWQWPANPQSSWWSQRGGRLRLNAMPRGGPNLWMTPSLLLQKWPAPTFTARTRVDASGLRVGEQAGLVVFGLDYATLVVERTERELVLRQARSREADQGTPETAVTVPLLGPGPAELSVEVAPDASCRFLFAARGGVRQPIGEPFAARPGLWVGARVGLFAAAAGPAPTQGHAEFEWFRVE